MSLLCFQRLLIAFIVSVIGKIPSTSVTSNGPLLYDTTNKNLRIKTCKTLFFSSSSSLILLPVALPSSALFKEICPGGMGYHVTGHIKPKPAYPQPRPQPPYQEPVLPQVPLPTAHKPVEALSVTERQLPVVPGESIQGGHFGKVKLMAWDAFRWKPEWIVKAPERRLCFNTTYCSWNECN